MQLSVPLLLRLEMYEYTDNWVLLFLSTDWMVSSYMDMPCWQGVGKTQLSMYSYISSRIYRGTARCSRIVILYGDLLWFPSGIISGDRQLTQL